MRNTIPHATPRPVGSTNNFSSLVSSGVRLDGRLLSSFEATEIVNLAIKKLDPERRKVLEQKFFRANARNETIPQEVKIVLGNAIREVAVEYFAANDTPLVK